jgi:hypothetical protein
MQRSFCWMAKNEQLSTICQLVALAEPGGMSAGQDSAQLLFGKPGLYRASIRRCRNAAVMREYFHDDSR